MDIANYDAASSMEFFSRERIREQGGDGPGRGVMLSKVPFCVLIEKK